MKKNILILIVGLILLFMLIAFLGKRQKEIDSIVEVPSVIEETSPTLSTEQRYPYSIGPGSTLATALRQLDISSQDIHNLVIAAKPIKDLGRLHSGTRFQVNYAQEKEANLIGLRIKLSPKEALLLEKEGSVWTAKKIEKKVETKVITFQGYVKSSLWESAQEAQMNPVLISELSEIFAWQVDFSREVRSGDRWRLSVEQELVLGEPIGWGSILSAEYINSQDIHTAVLFRTNGEDVGYFTPDGHSLKRVFLKSPIPYSRISSKFQKKRFHPVLKLNRPHNGVDYAASTGTPIRVVGDGTVIFQGWSGGGGNVITIRHNSIYTTSYKHLSRFAKGLRKGTTVSQGQTIGYVGSTGLATGAHLHFEFFVNGRYVDPLGQKFPAADPVPKNYLTEFSVVKKNFLAFLPSWGADQKWGTDQNLIR
ncbi:MAG TPA: peptidoglycan DD-metalloendopeptidase family protein [Pseudobdellovibrionaceae bacterium]|nr:peptidoglycan DD-metalloendopeptidase family protein [Pseudobdellovibrionaceae bacterium]